MTNTSAVPLLRVADQGDISGKDDLIAFGQQHGLIGESPAFLSCLQEIRRFAGFSATVLLLGETGTGKELLARGLHGSRKGAFCAVNCGDMHGEMGRVELAGYRGQTFTGSDIHDRDGLFAYAEHGTLFLDEVQLLRRDLQPHLLRAMQEGRIRPVASKREIDVSSTRIVVASNENLEELVTRGVLRRDLYYRLLVLVVRIPPLRERLDDVPLLAEHFVTKHCASFGSEVSGISSSALQTLRRYTWPGNVRELENVIRGILARKEEGISIECSDLPKPLRTCSIKVTCKPSNGSKPVLDDVLLQHWPDQIPTLFQVQALYERPLIEKALQQTRGNQAQAARLLGISRETVKTRMRQFGIVISRSINVP